MNADSKFSSSPEIKKNAFISESIFLVGQVGIEPTTNGL